MKSKVVVFISSMLLLLGYVSKFKNQTYYAGLPISNALVLENKGFTVGYSDQRKNPIWVSYRLFKVKEPVIPKRPSKFKVDDRTKARVKHEDYSYSGYDRGHMAPNYAIATRYGKEAQQQTFLMSNVCPQKPWLNRGIWRQLELLNADIYANKLDEIWIVTGPVFYSWQQRHISGVEIPTSFYKIIVDEVDGIPRMLSFIVSQDITSETEIWQFLTNVDNIEKVTGIDFFSELEDHLENRLEAQISYRLW